MVTVVNPNFNASVVFLIPMRCNLNIAASLISLFSGSFTSSRHIGNGHIGVRPSRHFPKYPFAFAYSHPSSG